MATQNKKTVNSEDDDDFSPPMDLAAPAIPADFGPDPEKMDQDPSPPAPTLGEPKLYGHVMNKFKAFGREYLPGDVIRDPSLLSYCKDHRKPITLSESEY